MFVEDVLADQLDVLRDVSLCRAHASDPFLDVVDQTFRHGRVLVQVDQMWCLKKNGAMNEPLLDVLEFVKCIKVFLNTD